MLKLKNYYGDTRLISKENMFVKEINKDGYLYHDNKLTKIKESDLSPDYIKIGNYMGNYFINAKAIKQIIYSPNYFTNHLYKDDIFYISFDKELEVDENEFFKVKNYDYLVIGPIIVDFIREFKKINLLDLTKIEDEMEKKKIWFEGE